MQPTLHTARLTLRPWQIPDAVRLSALSRDEGFTQFTLAYRQPLDIATCANIIAERNESAQDGLGDWAILNGQRIIGALMLRDYKYEEDSQVEMGYRLEMAAWGKGYASEATAELVRYGLEDLKLERIVACIEPVNERSLGVVKRLGFKWWRSEIFQGMNLDVYSSPLGT